MKINVFLAAMLSALWPRLVSGDEAQPFYKQVYSIIIDGSPAGTETVEERAVKGGILSTSSHDILVTEGTETKRMTFTTSLKLDKDKYTPVSYSVRYTSGDSKDYYDVSIQKGTITRVLSRAGRTSEASLPLKPGIVIVDFNVFHQFDYLLRRYDFKSGGRQTFPDFLPIIASEITIALTRIEDSEIPAAGGKNIELRNFRVELVGIWLGIASFDHEGRLVRLFVQDKGLEVIRKDVQQE